MSSVTVQVREQLTRMPKRELQSLAKSLGISGFSSLSKNELVDSLAAHPKIAGVLRHPTWWSRHYNHVYGVAGVIGTLLTVLSLPYLSREISDDEHRAVADESNDGNPYRLDLFAAAQEMRKNKEYLLTLSSALRKKDSLIPAGSVSVNRTLRLFEKHYGQVTKYSYGEDKYVFQLAYQLDDIGKRINGIESIQALLEWNKKYEMTVDDAAFLAGFIAWYLAHVARQELNSDQMYALGIDVSSSTFALYDSDASPDMRYFLYEGEPILDYGLYLGLID